jgi:hypothetical protein
MAWYDKFTGKKDKKKSGIVSVDYPEWEINEREKMTAQLFKRAIESIEHPTEPYRFDYSRLVETCILDPVVARSLDLRSHFTRYCEFKFVDKDGNNVEKYDKLIKTDWFQFIVKQAFRSIYTGHEFIQLEGFIEGVPQFKTYPNWLLLSSLDKALESSTQIAGDAIDYTKSPYQYSNLSFKYNEQGKGILTPLIMDVVFKSVGEWSADTKIYSNVRIFTTNSYDNAQAANYKAKVESPRDYLILKEGESFDFKSADTSASQNHSSLNDYINREIESLILGSAISAEKSFVGAVQVQKEILEMFCASDRDYICSVINASKCLKTFGLIEEGVSLTWSKEDKISEDNAIALKKIALEKYNVPDDVVEKVTGVEVVGKMKGINNGDNGANI